MRKAGGIVAIVAGSLGLLAVIIGFLIGGVVGEIDLEEVDALLESEGTSLEESLEEEGISVETLSDETLDEAGQALKQHAWTGALFSLATIVIGVFAIRASNWIPGAVLIVCSVLGIFFAGGFAGLMMFVTALGGILALFPLKTEEPAAEEE